MNLSRSTLVLAPHASHPPMDGASYRSWSVAAELSRCLGGCTYLGKNIQLYLPPAGSPKVEARFGGNRGKMTSAVRTLLKSSHYLVEKHLPRGWRERARLLIREKQPELVYVNFLWAFDCARAVAATKSVFVDTHNFDPEWWTHLQNSSGNFISKEVCKRSLNYVMGILGSLPSRVTLVHVSRADEQRYLQARPDLRHLILPNGCEVMPRATVPNYSVAKKQLYLLGALNLRITLDCLKDFASKFWPELLDVAEMNVIGSGYSRELFALCGKHGWRLHTDLPEDLLSLRLQEMHFLVMPFSYSAGSKLKLVNACGRAIPVLSTPEGVGGFEDLPPTVFVSGAPAEWRRYIQTHGEPSPTDVAQCLHFAKNLSWEALVKTSGVLDAANSTRE